MTGFSVVPAEDHDPRLFAILAARFPRNLATRYEWLYARNPHGRALTWLALDASSGEPAGCTSMFPRRVVVEGRTRTGAIGGDCFVQPNFRRRGVATLLHRTSIDEMAGRGVSFMYGPPNPQNLAALLKAGSRPVADFRYWVRPLREGALHKGPLKLVGRWAFDPVARAGLAVLDRVTRPRVRVALEPVDAFDAEYDALFEACAPTHRITCVRDRAYLTWRYLGTPAGVQRPFAVRRGGELVGVVALERAGDKGALIDLFTAEDPELVGATIQAVVDHVGAEGCQSLDVSATTPSLLGRRLGLLGFVPVGVDRFQVAVADDDPQADVLRCANAWHFTVADEDMDETLDSPPPGEGPSGP
jgi:GNAT superfamily N-acetyltransferase